ncbi:hypothetical protein E2C01_013901 [Portunus trituberculatus]|uniref:Uncharacterized protein n=1 Tax=Portunus trituberculatus TaxID=210409 RepID=A0A5B7DIM8_PORTR|nr:hypothetical protein [Portunus trituberculatus]
MCRASNATRPTEQTGPHLQAAKHREGSAIIIPSSCNFLKLHSAPNLTIFPEPTDVVSEDSRLASPADCVLASLTTLCPKPRGRSISPWRKASRHVFLAASALHPPCRRQEGLPQTPRPLLSATLTRSRALPTDAAPVLPFPAPKDPRASGIAENGLVESCNSL